ncbi:hypothetical protein EON66_00090 [archaeon]|nr:MAG: hypothetical protein EON66_00090 [archaeon]
MASIPAASGGMPPQLRVRRSASTQEHQSLASRMGDALSRGVFGVLFMMNKEDTATSNVVDFVLYLVSFAQLASIPLSISFWSRVSLMAEIGSLASYFTVSSIVKADSAVAALFTFFVSLGWVVTLLLAALYAAVAFVRSRFSVLWPLKLLRLTARISVGALNIPLLNMLTQVLVCSESASGQLMWEQAGWVCWTGQHMVWAVITLVVLVLFIVLQLITSAVFYPRDPAQRSIMTKLHGRTSMLRNAVEVTLAVALSLGGANSSVVQYAHSGLWPLRIINFLAGLALMGASIYFLPFYYHDMNRVEAASYTAYSWIAFMTLVQPAFSNANTAAITLWFGSPLLAYAGSKLADARRDYLLRVPAVDVRMPLVVEVKARLVQSQLEQTYSNLHGARFGAPAGSSAPTFGIPGGGGSSSRREYGVMPGSDLLTGASLAAPWAGGTAVSMPDGQVGLTAAQLLDGAGDAQGRGALSSMLSRKKLELQVFAEVEDVYRIALERNPSSATLHIFFARYLQAYGGGRYREQELVHLSAAEQREPVLDFLFLLRQRRRQMEDEDMAGGGEEGVVTSDGVSQMSVINRVAYEKHLSDALINAVKSREQLVAFWDELRTLMQLPDLDKLHRIGGEFNEYAQRAEVAFSAALRLNPKDVFLLRKCAQFMSDVIDNEPRARALLEEADELEDTVSKASRNRPASLMLLSPPQTQRLDVSSPSIVVITFYMDERQNMPTIQTATPNLGRLMGYSGSDVVRQPLSALIARPLNLLLLKMLQRWTRGDRIPLSATAGVLPFRHRTGYIIPAITSVRPLLSGLGFIMQPALVASTEGVFIFKLRQLEPREDAEGSAAVTADTPAQDALRARTPTGAAADRVLSIGAHAIEVGTELSDSMLGPRPNVVGGYLSPPVGDHQFHTGGLAGGGVPSGKTPYLSQLNADLQRTLLIHLQSACISSCDLLGVRPDAVTGVAPKQADAYLGSMDGLEGAAIPFAQLSVDLCEAAVHTAQAALEDYRNALAQRTADPMLVALQGLRVQSKGATSAHSATGAWGHVFSLPQSRLVRVRDVNRMAGALHHMYDVRIQCVYTMPALESSTLRASGSPSYEAGVDGAGASQPVSVNTFTQLEEFVCAVNTCYVVHWKRVSVSEVERGRSVNQGTDISAPPNSATAGRRIRAAVRTTQAVSRINAFTAASGESRTPSAAGVLEGMHPSIHAPNSGALYLGAASQAERGQPGTPMSTSPHAGSFSVSTNVVQASLPYTWSTALHQHATAEQLPVRGEANAPLPSTSSTSVTGPPPLHPTQDSDSVSTRQPILLLPPHQQQGEQHPAAGAELTPLSRTSAAREDHARASAAAPLYMPYPYSQTTFAAGVSADRTLEGGDVKSRLVVSLQDATALSVGTAPRGALTSHASAWGVMKTDGSGGMGDCDHDLSVADEKSVSGTSSGRSSVNARVKVLSNLRKVLATNRESMDPSLIQLRRIFVLVFIIAAATLLVTHLLYRIQLSRLSKSLTLMRDAGQAQVHMQSVHLDVQMLLFMDAGFMPTEPGSASSAGTVPQRRTTASVSRARAPAAAVQALRSARGLQSTASTIVDSTASASLNASEGMDLALYMTQGRAAILAHIRALTNELDALIRHVQTESLSLLPASVYQRLYSEARVRLVRLQIKQALASGEREIIFTPYIVNGLVAVMEYLRILNQVVLLPYMQPSGPALSWLLMNHATLMRLGDDITSALQDESANEYLFIASVGSATLLTCAICFDIVLLAFIGPTIQLVEGSKDQVLTAFLAVPTEVVSALHDNAMLHLQREARELRRAQEGNGESDDGFSDDDASTVETELEEQTEVSALEPDTPLVGNTGDASTSAHAAQHQQRLRGNMRSGDASSRRVADAVLSTRRLGSQQRGVGSRHAMVASGLTSPSTRAGAQSPFSATSGHLSRQASRSRAQRRFLKSSRIYLSLLLRFAGPIFLVLAFMSGIFGFEFVSLSTLKWTATWVRGGLARQLLNLQMVTSAQYTIVGDSPYQLLASDLYYSFSPAGFDSAHAVRHAMLTAMGKNVSSCGPQPRAEAATDWCASASERTMYFAARFREVSNTLLFGNESLAHEILLGSAPPGELDFIGMPGVTLFNVVLPSTSASPALAATGGSTTSSNSADVSSHSSLASAAGGSTSTTGRTQAETDRIQSLTTLFLSDGCTGTPAAACDTYLGGVMKNGLLAASIEAMDRAIVLATQYNASSLAAAFVSSIALSSSSSSNASTAVNCSRGTTITVGGVQLFPQTASACQTLTATATTDLQSLSRSYVHTGLRRTISLHLAFVEREQVQFVDIHLALVLAIMLGFLAFYVLVYSPSIQAVNRDLRRTLHMLLMLPSGVVRNVPSVQQLMVDVTKRLEAHSKVADQHKYVL